MNRLLNIAEGVDQSSRVIILSVSNGEFYERIWVRNCWIRTWKSAAIEGRCDVGKIQARSVVRKEEECHTATEPPLASPMERPRTYCPSWRPRSAGPQTNFTDSPA